MRTEETVVCNKCGKPVRYPIGYLTEQAKKKYECEVCREAVLENRVEKQQQGNRRLLVE